MNDLKIKILIVFLLSLSIAKAQYTASSMRHYIKIEAGVLKYYTTTLSENTNVFRLTDQSFDVNAIWGWDFNEKKHLGLGGGYFNSPYAQGASLFGEVNFYVSNNYLNPYIGGRLGYAYLSPDGYQAQGNIMASFLVGLQIKLGMYNFMAIYLQSGLLYEHKTLFMPLRLGFKF